MLCAKKLHWNVIETSLELHLYFIESVLKVEYLSKVLVRFISSSSKANTLRSIRLNPLFMTDFIAYMHIYVIDKKVQLGNVSYL